ncbi:transcriptional regulator, TetR family [Jatrophihabitans endophyticus]|uniref:Transcriptional regulator, TetR family n=1 Tax=Jatrophihabitans endophyticus TaxID=1206085 RepID=A0A1M5GJK9_9ACTN|nr:transcriptional regulator, TetR family [Jatrophihabitans endophyticus]
MIGTKGVPRAEREGQIVAAAIAEFARAGYNGASMLEIARQAGISKPLVYQYFGSKDGMFLVCLREVGGGLLARLDEAELAVDDTVASRIYPLRAMFAALAPQREAWRLLFDATVPLHGPIADVADEYRSRLTTLAAGGSARFLRARGNRSRADASALTSVWLGLVNSLVTWWLEHPEESAAAMTARCERLLGAILT